jgi:zinc protease
MKYFNNLNPLAVAIALGIGLATGGLPAAHADAAPASVAQMQQDNVLRATLDNGLRVVILRNTLAPTVTTQITYHVGGFDTPKGFPGTAHALEHMMFRDSTGMSNEQLTEMSGKMGGDFNAFTTSDATQYYFVAPSQYLETLLHIEAIRMRSAKLTDKDWSLEKGAIEQEVSRDISDPETLAFQQAQGVLFAGTGYAEDALGTRPSFDKTTGATLRSVYDRWYGPNNATLVIAGDVDPQDALAKVKKLFGPIDKIALPAAHAPVKLESFKPQTISRSTPKATGSVMYLYRTPGYQSKDGAALQVLQDVLSNARSKLSDLAAQGKVLSADAQAAPFSQAGIFAIEAGFAKGGDKDRAAAELNRVIEELLKNGVSPELVEAAKRNESAQYEFSKNNPTGLASSWSHALVWQGLNSPQEALDQILAVTPQDVDRVARKYLTPDQRITVVLTPSADGKRPPDSHGFGGTETFASNATLDAPLPSWASEALAKLELPHWTLDPVKMKLSNGITLIVQPESVSKTVTVMGHVDHDDNLQEPNGQEGVGKLLGSLFDYGTTSLDRNAFHAALDEAAATESAGPDFSVAVPSANFGRGMQLLADNELHPALLDKAFKVQQETLARTLAGELQSPNYKMFRALHEGLLPAGDPALRQAVPATVDKLTLADAKDYYAKTYRPDMTTIVVVGNVTPEQAKTEVEKYFGAWQASGPRPDVIPKPVSLNPAGYTVVPNAYASQDTVFMGQMLDLNLHDSNRYALELGNEILGSNGFASRLMLDIRVRHGYAYGASSQISFDRSRSILYVYYGSDAEKVKPVDQLILKNLDEMRNTPMSAGELTNARQALIRLIPLEVSSVDGIARSLLTWSYKGEPLDQPMVAAKSYLQLTAQQVQNAFKTYVKPANLMQVVTGPAPKQH